MRGALGGASSSSASWAPWWLAGLGVLLSFAGGSLLPVERLAGPVRLEAAPRPPLEVLGGKGLGEGVRFVSWEMPRGGVVMLRVRGESGVRGQLAWALAPRGVRAMASGDVVVPPEGSREDVSLGWFPAGSYVLHLLVLGEHGPRGAVEALVVRRPLPPPWLEVALLGALSLPLLLWLLRRSVGV